MFGVLNRSEKEHSNNMFVSAYVARDIALSTRGTYDTECFFVDEKVARAKLKKYIKAKTERLLEELTQK